MRKFKKTLSVALAAIMALSSAAVSSTAFAADVNDASTAAKAAPFKNTTIYNNRAAGSDDDFWYLFKPAKSADYTFTIGGGSDTEKVSLKVGVYDGVRKHFAKVKGTTEDDIRINEFQNELFDTTHFTQILHTSNEGDIKVNKYDAGINNKILNLDGIQTKYLDAAYTYLVKVNCPKGTYATMTAYENTGYDYDYVEKKENITLYDKDGKAYETDTYTTGVGARIKNYYGKSTNLTMPKTIGGYDVVEVDLSSMSTSKKKDIVKMTIPSTVTRIFDCDNMYSLKSVNMPSDLTYISAGAFAEDMALTKRVDFGKKVNYIGDGAFQGTNIAGVSLAKDDTQIGTSAFGYTHGLNLATKYLKYDHTDDIAIKNFFVVANADSTGATYAKKEGFPVYNAADCAAGKHQYALTKTVAATIWAAGSKTYTCKVCDATKVDVIAKKVLKAYVKGGKNKFTVKASAMAGQTGYQIKFTKNGKSKSVKVKNARALNTTVKGLKAGKYKVKVRAYKKTSNGTKYSSYSAAKTVKVK